MQYPELSKGTSNGVALRLFGQGTSDDCEDAAGVTLTVKSLSSSGTSEGITLKPGVEGLVSGQMHQGWCLLRNFLQCVSKTSSFWLGCFH